MLTVCGVDRGEEGVGDLEEELREEPQEEPQEEVVSDQDLPTTITITTITPLLLLRAPYQREPPLLH